MFVRAGRCNCAAGGPDRVPKVLKALAALAAERRSTAAHIEFGRKQKSLILCCMGLEFYPMRSTYAAPVNTNSCTLQLTGFTWPQTTGRPLDPSCRTCSLSC